MKVTAIHVSTTLRRLLSILPLTAGVLLSILLMALVLLHSVEQQKRVMGLETQDLFNELNISLDAMHGELVELAKLISLAPRLSKQNLDSVVPELLANKPERRIVAWLPQVKNGDLQSYLARLKKENPDADIDVQQLLADRQADPVWPGNNLPVAYVALQPGESIGLGRDMLSSKEMQTTIMHVVDTNTPGLKITPSRQGPGGNSLYLFEPVYAVSLVPRNIKERREQLVGVIMLKVDIDLWLARHVQAGGTEVLVHTEEMHSVFEQEKTFFEINVMNHLQLVDEKLYLHARRSIGWAQLDYFAALIIAFSGMIVVWLSHRLLLAQYKQTDLLQARNKYSEELLDIQRDQLMVKDNLLHQQKKVMDEHSIISMADITGRITYVNDKFCEMSGYSREELIGQNHRIVNSGTHSESFFKHMWRTIASGKTWNGVVCNKAKDGSLYWVDSIIKPFFDEKGHIDHYISMRTDITVQINAQKMLSSQRQLLDMVQNSMRYFVQVSDLRQLGNSIIKELCTLTQSEFAIMGEVRTDESGRPYLKVHAVSDLSWNETSYKLYLENKEKGMEFHNLDTVLTRPIATGKAYISNDVVNDEYAGGQPVGHPAIRNYLGVPIYGGGTELVGMYGIANNHNGYDEKLLAYLRPFTIAYGVMINAARLRDKERSVQLEMIDAKNAAETANHAKSEFLSRMSHELRTPLNAILGFGQLLKSDTEQPLSPDQQENVGEILQAGKHLLNLISEILDLSRIESGNIRLELRPTRVRDVLEECCSLIMPLAEQHKISLKIDMAECGSIEVKADYLRLKQVILNLLSNAVKYNVRGGSVTVRCEEKDENWLVISVIDTGKGIAAHFHKDVFRPFSRMDAATSGIEGAGIGLVISRRFIEVMGGKIDFESVEGKGSTFRIEIERATRNEVFTQQHEVELQETVAELNSSEHDRVYKMLYVEDNMANMRLMEHFMRRRKDIEMMTAETGEQGVERAVDERPDIILMDINLPGMNGYEALTQIRRHRELDSVPVIALSANAMLTDIESGIEAGFSAYITKPLDARKFTEVLNTAIKSIENNKPLAMAH